MSKKRPLTTEEKAMAARIKAIFAADRDRTEEAAAVSVGVTQGQISHWTNGRLPVPAKRAPGLAQYLGIDDPGEISVAYRELGLPRQNRKPVSGQADLAELELALGLTVQALAASIPPAARELLDQLDRKRLPMPEGSYLRVFRETIESQLAAPRSRRPSRRTAPESRARANR